MNIKNTTIALILLLVTETTFAQNYVIHRPRTLDNHNTTEYDNSQEEYIDTKETDTQYIDMSSVDLLEALPSYNDEQDRNEEDCCERYAYKEGDANISNQKNESENVVLTIIEKYKAPNKYMEQRNIREDESQEQVKENNLIEEEGLFGVLKNLDTKKIETILEGALVLFVIYILGKWVLKAILTTKKNDKDNEDKSWLDGAWFHDHNQKM